MKIVIASDGSVKKIAGGGFELVGGDVTRRRASHVEPVSWALRQAFRAARLLGLAEWTRTWECRWRVDTSPSGGGILPRTWGVRSMALAAEVLWLERRDLAGGK